MLLHVIGKMQTYDNLVLEYPSIIGLSRATSLALSMIIESAFAAMVMIGVATRFVSVAMVVLTLLSLVKLGEMEALSMSDLKIDFVYIGIYITLIISGSGIYGFNVPWLGNKNDPKS